MKAKNLLASAILLSAAMIWGVAFVAQNHLSDSVAPFTVNAVRSLIASAALVPAALLTRRMRGLKLCESRPDDRKKLLKAGVICGTMLCISVNLQQFGIALYPAGAPVEAHSGFLTALYILFVPLFGLFYHKKPGRFVLIAAVIAAVGLYFLCFSGGIGGLYLADLIILLCGMSFAVQILAIDHYIGSVDPVKLSALQFFLCGVLSAILMLLFEKPDIGAVLGAWQPLLYLALLSSAGGYTLQIVGQKLSDNPTLASILMSMESVFAALGGALFSHTIPQAHELIGCGVMFAAIIIAQLPDKLLKRKKTSL